jgi:glycosyltransferase involved in cell wall biosynthesis
MKNNKNIIFVGNPVPGTLVDSSRVLNFNIADNIAQNTVIEGLYKNYGKNLTVIAVSPEETPKDLDLGYGVKAVTITSRNSNRIVYYLSIAKNYTKKLNEVLKNNHTKNTIVLTSGPYIYMALPVLIARWRRGVRWIPFLVGAVEVPEAKFPYSLASKLSRWTVNQANGAITYVARSVIDYMPGRSFVEIFYLIEDKLMDMYHTFQPKRPKKFTITYTGALTSIYNVDIIIDVIKKTGNTYHWVFAGGGQYADIIEKLSLNKKYDVEYLGFVTNVEAIKLQKSSHLLLCLKGGDRTKINQYYSKYAASGKLIEYLCSGTPILVGDIPAFSDNIKPFMTSEKDQTVEQVTRDIAKIKEDYTGKLQLAQKGQKYAFKHCTADYQNKNIYEFLEKL